MIAVGPGSDVACRWLEGEIGGGDLGSDLRVLAAYEDGKVLGAVGFHGWTHSAAILHIAIADPRCMRRLARECHELFFHRLGRIVAIGLTPANHKRAMRLRNGLGFRTTHVIADGWAKNVGLVVGELRHDDCRWAGCRSKLSNASALELNA